LSAYYPAPRRGGALIWLLRRGVKHASRWYPWLFRACLGRLVPDSASCGGARIL